VLALGDVEIDAVQSEQTAEVHRDRPQMQRGRAREGAMRRRWSWMASLLLGQRCGSPSTTGMA
jgi:hypothetical protein